MVALAQIARPGAPMIYGSFLERRHADRVAGVRDPGVRQGGVCDRPDGPSLQAAVAVVERGGLEHVVDAQAAYSPEMAIWGAIMGGVSLLYQGAGWLEGGAYTSFEKLSSTPSCCR